MIDNIPRISVLIITYNQENLLPRAINSLLSQKDYIYEICISDDCSSDRSWEIMQDYSNRYPGLFKLNRNNPNVGMFENMEKTWTMSSGDITYQLSGDDECGEGWFKKVIEFIKENKIDYRNELFCIYGDYEGVDPYGKRTLHRNNLAISNKNQFSLSLRGIVGNRSACYSTLITRKFFKVSQGRSHIAESALDRQLQLFTEKSYYIPMIGNIYYSGIGESTVILRDNIFPQRKQINPYMIEQFAKYGYQPTKSDLRYIAYDNAFLDFIKSRSLVNACILIFRWMMAYDPQIGVKSLNLDFILPHLKKVFVK